MNKERVHLETQMNGWMRISLQANKGIEKLNNLFCHFTVAHLLEAYQSLDGNKATGIDGRTKREYGKNLSENLQQLVTRLHKGTYRPLPRKRVNIPKADGRLRPIAISAFEDKLVEWVTAKILGYIYEPLFINTSFGFRPRKSAHDAIEASFTSLKDDKRPFVVEIDLKSFFDTVPQEKLMKLLGIRISDKRFRSLIVRFLKAGVMEQNTFTTSDTGTAQGAIMSPILANVYLHYCLDEWFMKNYASVHGAVIIRYADDAIFLFKEQKQADTFKGELNNHLGKYGLSLNEDKSGIINFKKTKGNIFHFLGFSFLWSHDFTSKVKRLRVVTEKKRLHKAIQNFTAWIKEVRSKLPLDDIWDKVAAKLRGHYNYYGVMTNRGALQRFYHNVIGSLFKWLNRRSQRRSFTVERFARRLIFKPLPMPPPTAALKILKVSATGFFTPRKQIKY